LSAGRPNEELLRIVEANVRAPHEVLGDIHAQVAGNDVGGRRLLDFMDEFGLKSIDPLADEIIGRSERAMRAAIEQVPDGVYENVVYSDGYEEQVRVQVRIEVRGDEMWVDFSGSSPESGRGINVVLNYTHAYTTFATKCALAPEVPNNEGSFRPVHVSAPPGCILNAQHPAPVGARHIIGHFLPGAIFGALAEALPDRVMAEGAANIWSLQLSGRQADDSLWTYVWFSSGGTGARPTKDGINATAFPSGISGVPAEVIESLSPVVMHRRELRRDSGGPGRHRGGLGQTLDVAVRSGRPFTISPLFDRSKVAAQGYAGGRPGALARITASTGEVFAGKGMRTFPPDTHITLDLPGGGGFFAPVERDPRAVLDDVLDGYVSLESAEHDYGVVIDPATLTVDDERTRAARAAGAG
jgi:N-methylhydantoinase B